MLAEPLLRHAATNPDRLAILDDRGETTYGRLAAGAVGLSRLLAAKTERATVGVLLPSGAAFATAFYATLLARKSVVPINFLLGEREVRHVLIDAGLDTVLSAPPLAERLAGTGVNVIDLMALAESTPPSAAAAASVPPPALADPSDLAVVMYTSGTSGLPKGAELTHGNFAACVRAAIGRAALNGEHRFFGVVPLFHSLGLTATLLAPIELGTSVVYQARFNPVAAVEGIARHRASIVFGIPSMFGAMLRTKSLTPESMAGTFALITGGEPLPEKLRLAFEARTGKTLLEGYGLTETCGPIAVNVPHDRRPGSVGKLLPGTIARVLNEDGRPLPAGETGEIRLSGPTVLRGYRNLPDETASAVIDTPGVGREFVTGDLGRLDADGYLYVTGRKKDLIIVSGEKVYPREVEDLLRTHQAVADVAVVPKPDESRGQTVAAFVVPNESVSPEDRERLPATLRDYCSKQGLIGWKCPRDVIMIDELPRNPTGKVLKRDLEARLAAQPG